MQPKRIEVFMRNMTEDITQITKGYSKIEVESSYGNLWFLKDGLREKDAIRIEVGKTYDLAGIVQIQRINRGKSKPTITIILS